MITELIITGAIYKGWQYLNTKDERRFKNRFSKIMISIGVKNKEEQTFKMYKIVSTSYGYKAYINIPNGLSLEHLNSKINILEDNLNGIIEFKKDKFKPNITMRIVDRDIDKYKFVPVKCELYQLYIGKDFKGKDYFIDLNKDPHLLIAGTTGTGKSFLLASILTNLIYNTPRGVDIYLSQIVKGDIGAFKECQAVKFVATSIEEVNISLNKVSKILDNRSELFGKHGVRNILQWNNHFPTRKMKRIIYVIEELSFLMDYESIWSSILKIAKAGRSVGVHLISCVQRSTATNLPPDLKSQLSKITFRQKSTIDSLNIINITDAVELKERECIVDSNTDTIKVKTPWVDEDFILLHKYVPEISIPTKEIKQEILKVNKENEPILITEVPKIIDIEPNSIVEMRPSKTSKKKKGILSLKEVEERENHAK